MFSLGWQKSKVKNRVRFSLLEMQISSKHNHVYNKYIHTSIEYPIQTDKPPLNDIASLQKSTTLLRIHVWKAQLYPTCVDFNDLSDSKIETKSKPIESYECPCIVSISRLKTSQRYMAKYHSVPLRASDWYENMDHGFY